MMIKHTELILQICQGIKRFFINLPKSFIIMQVCRKIFTEQYLISSDFWFLFKFNFFKFISSQWKYVEIILAL